MKPTFLVMAFFMAMGPVSPASAQELAFIIRHAEKEATGDDPRLSAAGRSRARMWAELLGKSGIDVVVHTDAARSRETGDIIAGALDLEQVELPMADTAGLMDLLAFDHAEDTVLVIAHTETIPSILFQLGVAEPPEVETDDFANLFLVSSAGRDAPMFLVLRMP